MLNFFAKSNLKSLTSKQKIFGISAPVFAAASRNLEALHHDGAAYLLASSVDEPCLQVRFPLRGQFHHERAADVGIRHIARFVKDNLDGIGELVVSKKSTAP